MGLYRRTIWPGLKKAVKRGRAVTRRMIAERSFPKSRAKSAHLTVVSFPKSGRTWIRVMLDQLDIACNYTHDGSAHTHVPALHFDALSPANPAYASRNVVLLFRDPRDTAVSGYFHLVKRHGAYGSSLSAFIRDPCHGIEKNVRFNLAWLEKGPHMRGFLPLAYEQLRTDTVEILRRIIDFAGETISIDEIAGTVADNTFDKMQQRERTGQFAARYGLKLSPRGSDADGFNVRKGKVRGYLDYFSPEDERYCNEILTRYCYFDTVQAALDRYWPPATTTLRTETANLPKEVLRPAPITSSGFPS